MDKHLKTTLYVAATAAILVSAKACTGMKTSDDDPAAPPKMETAKNGTIQAPHDLEGHPRRGTPGALEVPR